MYEDASSAFGMLMLPARVVPKARGDASEDLSALPPEFQPNHHIFYSERLRDVADGLPKWKTVIQGQLEEDDAREERVRVQGHSAATGQCVMRFLLCVVVTCCACTRGMSQTCRRRVFPNSEITCSPRRCLYAAEDRRHPSRA
jgi:hypothetical protein